MIDTNDYVRIRPGKPIDGVSYSHVEVAPEEGRWVVIRATAEQLDAIRVLDRISKTLHRAHNSRGGRR